MKTEDEIRRAAYLLTDEAGRRRQENIPGWASRAGMGMALLWVLGEEGDRRFDEYIAAGDRVRESEVSDG